jgi:hypothetical protein
MLRSTLTTHNVYLTAAIAKSPATVIRSGRRFWSSYERLVQYKTLYFTLGMDAQPLRRTAVIIADKQRIKNARHYGPFKASGRSDTTGFNRKRLLSMLTWHKRMQYQEYYMQHMMTRHVWGVLRMYPTGGAKIAGKNGDVGYMFDDNGGVHRYTRQLHPTMPPLLYDKRRWAAATSLQMAGL